MITKFELDEIVTFNVNAVPGEALISIWEEEEPNPDNTYKVEDVYNDKVRFVGYANFVHEDYVQRAKDTQSK